MKQLLSFLQVITLISCLTLISSCAKRPVIIDTEKQHIAITKVLLDQQEAWNNGDIEQFMKGYWQTDLLSFVGKSGPTFSWSSTLSNYKKAYPDRAAMGRLHFDIIDIRTISEKTAYMIGKFTLTRKDDMPSGYFTLLWEKKEGKWVITSDHTSS